eukprot:763643-Hanusia_phi.AAC.3
MQSLALRGKQRMLSGRAAVALAASHPGGMIHTDDSYISVGSGPRTQSLATSTKLPQHARPVLKYRGQDRVVSLKNVQPSMYPMMGLAEAGQSPSTPNEHFGRAIRRAHAGDGEKGVKSLYRQSQGWRMELMMPGATERRALSIPVGPHPHRRGSLTRLVQAAEADRWAYYGAIFIVLVGSAILLLYNLLPKGSIERGDVVPVLTVMER